MEVFDIFLADSPKITKMLTILILLVSLLTWFEIVSPLNLYINYELIFKRHQYWRLITNFFYFGNFSLSLIFHLILFFRTSKYLENFIFRGNAADYIYFMIVNMFVLSIVGPIYQIMFISNSLSFAMTYYWGRKSKNTLVNFMGMFTFRAPYLPWVYFLFSYLLDSEFKNDLVGMLVGHSYFYIKDILPRLKKGKGLQLLKTPGFIITLCDWLNLNNEGLGPGDDMNEMMF